MPFFKVVWTNTAKFSLDFYCDLIAEESPENAKKVRKEIIDSSKNLSKYPLKFQLDEYYPENNGNIRRYFRWDYRIVYEVRDSIVIILDVQHSKNVY